MTNQQVYEAIREFFNRPDAVLAMWQEECVYRADNDPTSEVRCAFGCVIPNDLYQPGFERKNAETLLTHSNVTDITTGGKLDCEPLRAHFKGVTPHFIQKAQEAHDRADNVSEFIFSLDRIAADFNLKVAA